MTERVMDIELFPTYFLQIFQTKQVRIRFDAETMTLRPINDTGDEKKPDYIRRVRGMLADYPEMAVDKFLARMRTDAELDL